MDQHSLTIAALAWARSSGLVLVAPGWNLPGIGVRVKLVLSALVAFAIWPVAHRVAPDVSTNTLPLIFVTELATGATLGLLGALVVAGIRQGGELVAMQAGLSPASVIAVEAHWDSDTSATPFGHLFAMLALVVFVSWNGPMLLVESLARSYESISPEGSIVSRSALATEPVAWFLGLLNAAVVVAFQAAAPMGLALLVAGLVLAFLARGPGHTLSGMAWPLRWLLAIVLFLACLPGLLWTIEAAWQTWARNRDVFASR